MFILIALSFAFPSVDHQNSDFVFNFLKFFFDRTRDDEEENKNSIVSREKKFSVLSCVCYKNALNDSPKQHRRQKMGTAGDFLRAIEWVNESSTLHTWHIHRKQFIFAMFVFGATSSPSFVHVHRLPPGRGSPRRRRKFEFISSYFHHVGSYTKWLFIKR